MWGYAQQNARQCGRMAHAFQQSATLPLDATLTLTSVLMPAISLLCLRSAAGHPSSVDSLVALDHDTVITGSADGLIRVRSFSRSCMVQGSPRLMVKVIVRASAVCLTAAAECQ
jgi:hypothetical protein